MLTKEELIQGMSNAMISGQGYEVSISSPDLVSPEIIYNPNENLSSKIEYYMKAYNNKLELIAHPAIKITSGRPITYK